MPKETASMGWIRGLAGEVGSHCLTPRRLRLLSWDPGACLTLREGLSQPQDLVCHCDVLGV